MCGMDITVSMDDLVTLLVWFFFFNDTATTEIYTLSLHDALPILGTLKCCTSPRDSKQVKPSVYAKDCASRQILDRIGEDRKSTRLNSSHANISYAVFCLKKKKKSVYPRHADIQ